MSGALRALQGEPAGLVLLLDPILHSLPVEACKEIRDTHFGVARDFSIHALYSEGAGPPSARRRTRPSSSIQEERTRARLARTSRGRRCWRTSRAIARTRNTWVRMERASLDDHIAKDDEVQELLQARTSGGYVFYGPGRAGPPAATLATLSCEGVRMALIVDRADSDLTQRRRSKQASAKTKTDFMLEGPLETAALYCLAGAGSAC